MNIAAALAVAAGGCASSPPPRSAVVEIDAGRYADIFDATRGVLRDQGFVLERVDSAEGVITSQPKTTAGVATPWDREQQSAEQELQDLFQRQQRVIRVTFHRDPDGQPASPVTARVHAVIQRVQIPGAKLEPEAIRQSSYFLDTDLAARQMHPSYAVAVARDEALEARLASLIRQRISSSSAGGSTDDPEPGASASPSAPAPESEPEQLWTPARPLRP